MVSSADNGSCKVFQSRPMANSSSAAIPVKAVDFWKLQANDSELPGASLESCRPRERWGDSERPEVEEPGK
jgi:hypothetical protein